MSPVYRFDHFELDSERRELRERGKPVPIQPRPLDLLLYLAHHCERVISRAELLDAIWSGVQVNDEALSFAIHQARRAVGDDGSRQAVIRTVARSGFRFVAPLASVQPGEAEGAAAFVGRADVLASVAAVLRDASSGARTLLLLGGDAGIGKTRTVEVAAERAREQGFAVFTARCVESEGAPVFWPWIQLLRPIAAGIGAEELAAALGPGGPELARLVPEMRQRLPTLPDATQTDPKAARFLLFDSATALVRAAAASRPVLLVIDDLHRADLSSLVLLRDLTRQLAGTRVALLATHREVELSADAARTERVTELIREEGTRLLRLGGLCVEEVGELLRATTGRVSSAAVRADLHERTDGNPFFLHQVVQVLQSEQRAHEVERDEQLRFELPRHSQDAIARQVAGLPADVVRMLEVASVVGRDFAVRLLELAADLEREDLLALLDVACGARIIQACDGAPSQYRFTHVLLRDALYHRIEPTLRARLHADVGRAMLRLEGEGRAADPPTVAHHFFEAARTGDVSRALALVVRAARWAEERLAFEEAVAAFQQALDLCDRAQTPNQRRRCEILLALGDAQTKAGRRDAARECFQSVATLAKFEGLPEELAAAALRFAPDFLSIETGVHDPELVSLLEDALAALPEADSAVRARLLGRLAVALHWAPGSESRRRVLCDDAVAMAARLGNAVTQRYVECARELALYSIDDPERYIRRTSSAVPLEGQDAPIVLLEQLLRMTSLLQCGRLDEYERGVDVFTNLARQLRQPQALWYGDLFRATQASLEGRFADADAHARRYVEEGQRVQDRNVILSIQVQRFIAALDRGGLEEFEPPLLQMVASFPHLLGWRSALAAYYASTSREADAVREIRLLLDSAVPSIPKRNEWLGIMLGLGLAASEIDHEDAASLVLRLAEPHADELLVVGYASACWGSTACLLGIAATVVGDLEKASAYFRKAMYVNRRAGALAAQARTLFYEGRMLVERGKARSARQAFTEASELATRLGLRRLAERADLALRG